MTGVRPADEGVEPDRPGSAGETPSGLSLRGELGRKLIHLASVVLPLTAWFFPRSAALTILGGVAATAVAVELARRRVGWVQRQFLFLTRGLLRPDERAALSGATYMFGAYFIVFLVFPRAIAVTAMLYDTLGDAAAALVGRRWGRRRTSWGKSWEGAGAAFLVNLAAGVAVPSIGAALATAGALVAAGLEFLPLRLDDNLRVTLGGALALWLGSALTGSLS